MYTQKRTWFTLILSLLFVTLFVVACDDNQTNGTPGAGGGLGNETPGGVETGTTRDATPMVTVESTTIMEETEEPTGTTIIQATNTPMVQETPTTAMTPTMQTTPITTSTMESATPVATGTVVSGQTMSETNIILASDLVGMNIVNDADETVGEVSEVLVDMDGDIHYIVFDAGGFLGVAERNTAVTWDMFDAALPVIQDDGGLIAERTILFRGLPSDLETATELDMTTLDGEGFVLDAEEAGLLDSDEDRLLQLSEFSGILDNDFNLINTEEEDLGEVEDAILDLNTGKVVYAVVDFGGFLGVAENTVAVPWQRLEFNEENEQFILNVADITLEDAPLFDMNIFDDPELRDDLDWDMDIRNYWDSNV